MAVDTWFRSSTARAATAVLLLALATTACGGEEAGPGPESEVGGGSTPTAAPTADESVSAVEPTEPSVAVAKGTAALWSVGSVADREKHDAGDRSSEPVELAAGDEDSFPTGSSLLVGAASRAKVTVPGASGGASRPSDFLWLDMPRGALLQLGPVHAPTRLAECAVEGVARVILSGLDDADVTVGLPASSVHLTGGPADVVVIACPGPDDSDVDLRGTICTADAPGGWVAVAFGGAEVIDATPTASEDSAALATSLAKGQAAALSADGEVLAVVDLGMEAIDSWFTAFAAGSDAPLSAVPSVTPTSARGTHAPLTTTTAPSGAATRASTSTPGSEGQAELPSDSHEGSGSKGGGGGRATSESGGGQHRFPTRTPCATRAACPLPTLPPMDTPEPGATHVPETPAPATAAPVPPNN
jgi:hypothetical protein